MDRTTTTHLLYLHGFRSSPQSTKAQQMAKVARDIPGLTWWCPQLPPSPRAAAELIWEGTKNWPDATSVVMGSSLGGYYATWLASLRPWKAVVINPAVRPQRDLAEKIGKHSCWHDPQQQFEFTAEHVQELKALDCANTHFGHRVLPLIAKGDELLSWEEMKQRYPDSEGVLLEGGDHAFSDFEKYIPVVLAFMNCPQPMA